MDVELVRRLAGIIGYAGSVVLIGPDHLRDVERERLRLPNIFHVGPVPYVQLPEYMRRFDVCIVPHNVTPFTESLNPIKLWEYLALGKPVVSTRVAGFRDYPQLVYLADGAEELAARCRLWPNPRTLRRSGAPKPLGIPGKPAAMPLRTSSPSAWSVAASRLSMRKHAFTG